MAEANAAQRWAERITAQESSGLNRLDWCQQQGVNRNTLAYWRSRLRKRQAARELVPIVVGDSDCSSAAMVEITLADTTRVRASSAVNAAWLSALIRGMSGC